MFENILSQLGINETLWTQLAIFLIAFAILRTFYFKPFLSVMEKREKEGKEKRKEAEKLLLQAEQEELRYNGELSLARKEAAVEQEKKFSEMKGRASEEILKIKASNKQKMEQARTGIEKEIGENTVDLEKQSEKLSEEFIQKLIKTKVDL